MDIYQKFQSFDWSDQRWQGYLADLYPTPSAKQLQKFKKKWYKKNIDPQFDEAFEPVVTSSSGGQFVGTPIADEVRWSSLGTQRGHVCMAAYLVALTMAVAGFAGAFPAYQALVVLVGAFLLEILAKHGLRFRTEWLHSVLLDDVGVMPMMALTLLTPGLHSWVRLLALVPAMLTALLSLAQICKCSSRPRSICEFFAPLAATSARHKLMQRRADAELVLGAVLIGAVFAVRAAPISALLFWNFMMMRYMMSPWTQESFRRLDSILGSTLGRLPVVRKGYAALKRFSYSFVDPDSRRAGSMCSLL